MSELGRQFRLQPPFVLWVVSPGIDTCRVNGIFVRCDAILVI